MKKYIFFLLIASMNLTVSGQDCSNCDQIILVDKVIYARDLGLPALNSVPDKKALKQTIKDEVLNSLIPELKFEDEELFATRVGMITHVETITWLELVMQEQIEIMENFVEDYESYPGQSAAIWKERLAVVNERMMELFDKEFTYYRFTEHSNKWLKAIYIDHTNDIFHLRSKYNDDRDLTGAFRFEAVTDKLKLRLFKGYRWWNLNSRSWYTYQTAFVAGEGYTPYLRDTSVFSTPTSVDSNDRPFASFLYFGFSKHRIYRKGTFKMSSRWKFGTIGSAKPGGLQSIIHRDFNVGAYTPNGWGAQIAKGGRYAFQYDLTHEYMLLSRNWFFSKWTSVRTKNKMTKWPFWVNLSIFDDLRIGYDQTSAGLGLKFSTNDFKRSGDYDVPVSGSRIPWSGKRTKFAISFSYRYMMRYVVYNSMLQGFGVTHQLIDEDPNTPIDAYVLPTVAIRRWIQIHEWQIGIKMKHISIIYKNMLMSPEFDLLVNTKQYEFGDPEFTTGANHNVDKWNHVGTIGLLFNVK